MEMSDKNTLILKQSGMPEDFGFVMRNRAPMHVLPENELHWHDYFEMEFVYDGCGTQIVNAKTIPMSRGSVYLLTPLDFHTVIADETCGMSLMLLKCRSIHHALRFKPQQKLQISLVQRVGNVFKPFRIE